MFGLATLLSFFFEPGVKYVRMVAGGKKQTNRVMGKKEKKCVSLSRFIFYCNFSAVAMHSEFMSFLLTSLSFCILFFNGNYGNKVMNFSLSFNFCFNCFVFSFGKICQHFDLFQGKKMSSPLHPYIV